MKNKTGENTTTTMIGGLRIKKITHIIGDKVETTRYKYAINGKSSGKLMSVPFFFTGAIQRFQHCGSTTEYCLTRQYAKLSTNPFLGQSYTAHMLVMTVYRYINLMGTVI